MFGDRVKEIRESKGISRTFISKQLNKHSNWLFELETGRLKRISPEDLKSLAECLNVSIAIFFEENICEKHNIPDPAA